MIRVDRARVNVPATFDTPNPRTGKTEYERIVAHRAGPDRDETFDFAVYKTTAVKIALDDLFHGKCAYCESPYATTQPVDVEHYRPKGEVEGVAGHSGYWWLAMIWTNLLPSCIDCNRRREQLTPDAEAPSLVRLTHDADRNRWRKLSTGKASAFPLAPGSVRALDETHDCDLEDRLLLDPTRDEPGDHIGYYVDRANLVSLVYPRAVDAEASPTLPRLGNADQAADGAAALGTSAVGAVSIQVYGLNRLGLVQARTRLLRDFEFMLELSLGLTETLIELDERVSELRDQAVVAGDGRHDQEIQFLERIGCKIRGFLGFIKQKLDDAIKPSAPYSALARAWAKEFVERG